MGLAGGQARSQRQQRLGPIQRLDLRLLVHAQHHGVGRRIQVQTDHVVDLLLGARIGAELERLDPMGLQAWACQIRCTVVCDTPVRRASSRVVQWVSPARAASASAPRPALACRCAHGGRSPDRGVGQAGQPLLREAPPQSADLHHGVARPGGDGHPREPLGHQQHRPGPAAQPRRASRRPGARSSSCRSASLTTIGRTRLAMDPSPRMPWLIFARLLGLNTSSSYARLPDASHGPPGGRSSFDPDQRWETRDGIRTEIIERQKLSLDVMCYPLS